LRQERQRQRLPAPFIDLAKRVNSMIYVQFLASALIWCPTPYSVRLQRDDRQVKVVGQDMKVLTCEVHEAIRGAFSNGSE
jgi:hypothetical protein